MPYRKFFTTAIATVFVTILASHHSEAGTLGDFTYSDNGASITITQYNRFASGTLVVPTFIEGKPVTAIGSFAFGYSQMTSITLPATVTTVDDYAFAYAVLSNINLPEGLTHLGSSCFIHCRNLKSIVIPSTLTKAVAVFHWSGLERATIANGAQTVADGLFADAEKLEEVTLPPTVTKIGRGSFSNCIRMEKFEIPSSVTHIDDWAFSGSSLQRVSLSNRVKTLGISVFQGCRALKHVVLPTNLKEIPEGTFSGCKGLKTPPIPDSVVSIGSSAFYNCNFVSLTIPSKVRTIKKAAFAECRKLNRAIFTDEAPVMGPGVFQKSAPEFTIFLEEGSKGFTVPRWNGYRTSLPRPEIVVLSASKTDLESGTSQRLDGAVIGTTGTYRDFTIFNSGIRPLTDLNVIIDGGDESHFSVKNVTKKSLAPGKSRTVRVRFTPKAKGKLLSQLKIGSNDSDENPFVIKLTATGLKQN